MKENVIAVVAGKELTWEDFDEFLQNVPQEQRAYLSNPSAKEYYLQQMVALHLFAQMGEDEKLDETEEFEKIMQKARRDVLSQLAMRKVMENIQVTEQDKQAYFEEHKAQFVKGPSAQAKHILTDSEEKCLSILEEIRSGAKSFEDAAREYSTCPSGQKGGDLGRFGKGQMVKEFEDAVFGSEIGALVGPVKTQFGYHLIRVEDRDEGGEAVYEEVAPKIAQMVLQRKQQETYDAKVAELKAKYCE